MTFPDGSVKEGKFENNIFVGGDKGHQSEAALKKDIGNGEDKKISANAS